MAYKCCNYTDNTSPTLDQCKAIEVNWNKFVNDFFKEVDDKYPSTDLTKIDLEQGTKLLQNASTGAVKRHPTTNKPMYRVMTVDLEPIEIVDEELSVLRLKSHLQDIEDGIIHHNMQIVLNNQRMIVALSTDSTPITDLKQDEGDPTADPPRAADPNLVTTKGITTWISEGKLTLRTHEGHMQYGGYEREELIFSE